MPIKSNAKPKIAKQKVVQKKKLRRRSDLIKKEVDNKSIYYSASSMSNVNSASSHSNSISNTYLNGTTSVATSQQQLASSSTGNSNVVYQTLRSRKTNKSAVPLDERVFLDKAFGFTIQSNTRLSQSCDGTIAYLAGCVIVVYNCNDIQNQEFIISPAKKTLTCVAFSADGRMLATGESGHDPKVRVWDVREKVQLCEFSGHKFAIECVAFSTAPNSSLLVSVGSMHDMVVNVWNCRTKFKVASNKVACKVKGIAFSQDGSYFVTVGNRHVKFWYLTVSSLLETVPLRGRAGILGDMKNNYFCDVVCGRGANSHLTYAITTNGVLCEFNENRCLSSIAELHVERAYCIYADDANLFIGCSNGTILIFRQKILDCISSLSRPHSLGIDISKGQDTSHVLENIKNPNLMHPDCIALVYDKFDYILSAFYNDHSFYVWDIKDLDQVKKVDSHLFHSSSCGSIDTFSSVFLDNASNELVLPQFPTADSPCYNMPMDSFITCSSDNTLRIWTMNSLQRDEDGNNSSRLQRNIYSKELLKIIYIDNDLSALCEIDTSVDTSDPATERALATSQSISQLSKSSTDAVQNEVKMGARCIKISPHGRHLATGDRNGNIRIYDLSSLESICMIEAHIAEVLDLQYSQPESGRQLLASSSRDRLIHIFDASKNTYDLLQIIGDHSSAITAVRFCFNSLEKQLYIISCGADKSIMFRTAILDSNNNSSVHSPSHNSSNGGSSQSPTKYSDFVRTSYVAEKQTFHDMNVDPTRTYLNTISQDRMIREYSIKDGKKIRQFRGSLNEDGYLVKMDIDRTGQLMATACTDKIVYIWDMKSTECLAYLYGHSENINDLKFTNDGQYLITVGADGCLFTWRITNLYSYLTNQAPNSMVHSQSVNSLSTSRNMLRQSISMPMSNLTNGTIQPAPVPSVNNLHCPEKLTASTMEIPSILADTDSDECLPAWARKKLDDNANNVTTNMASTSRSSWATSTGALDLDSLAGSRRSGRAVWGQQINTSFAVAVDSELNSLASQPSMPSEVQEDPASTTSTPPNKSLHKNLNCIQFPSPCVNKDSYQVKQVSIEHKQVKNGASQRPSWICSNNEDDILFNMNRSGDSSGDDIDTPGSPVKADEDDVGECEPAEASDDLATKATADKCNSEANVEEKEATVDFNIAPLSFDSEYAKLMHDIPPCLNTPIRRQQPPTDKTCMSLGGTTGVDQNPIKLNCDMENSFRRSASISARYLLRTAAQQQKESQQNDMPNDSASTQIDPTLTPIKSASKPEKESNLSEAINQLTKNEAPVLEPVSEKMQPPPVPTPTMANEFKIRTRSRASVGGANFQLLYSHHTESSLSKAKPKQPQQFHSSNNLSKDVSTSENNKANASILSHQMKRSPSVNSITISVSQCDSKSQESSSSIASSSATSSTSSIKHSSNKSTSSAAQSAKSSPSRQSSTILNRSNTLDIHHTNTNETQTKPGRHSINVSTTSSATNLKKASSMVALNQGPSTKVRNKSTTQAHPLTKDPTQSQFLPPKTVRQVKQRSADRQLTTGAIASQPSTTKPTLTSFSNFAEQNKHLRKLSSSIQNLHHQSSAKTPTPAVKSPTSISIKTEPEPIPIKKPPTETNKTLANNPSNNSSNQLDLMNKLKKIDADQMSLSSSSVECLGQNDNDPIQLNTLDNDLDLLPNQPHSSSHTSNSLTSSSSSSCSLFESNTNQSNEPNELKSADLNEDEDKECYKTLSESQQQSNSRLCSADLDSSGVFNLNSFASTISSLKKPVTFASISKSKSANSSPNIISYTNPSKFNINSQSNNGGGSFSNSKVDSIRSEFFQNVKNLQFVLSQGSKNLDDYLKIYQKPTHHQQLKCLLTDQANQQIQHQIHSFVKQLNAVASLNNANESNSSVVANTTATTNNSTNTNIINSEEIELA